MGEFFLDTKNMVRYGNFALNEDYPNLVTNGDFTGWTAGEPDSWLTSISPNPPGASVTQVDPGDLFADAPGTGACNIRQTIFPNTAHISKSGIETLAAAIHTIDIDSWTNGAVDALEFDAIGDAQVILLDEDRHYSMTYTPRGVWQVRISSVNSTDTTDGTVDNIFVRLQTPWTFVQDWNLTSDTNAVLIASDTGSRKLSQVLGTIQGDLYEIDFTTSGISLDADNASLVCSLDGTIAAYVVLNEDVITFVRAGASPSSGLQFYVTNDTVGDTVAITDVVVKLRVSGHSNVTEEIIITGAFLIGTSPDFFSGPTGVYEKIGTSADGRVRYRSARTHPNVFGEETTWYVYWEVDTGSWTLSTTDGDPGDDGWAGVSNSYDPLDLNFIPYGTAQGVATANGGPYTIERRNQANRRSRYELVG